MQDATKSDYYNCEPKDIIHDPIMWERYVAASNAQIELEIELVRRKMIFQDEIIKLHDIARKIEEHFGQGALSENIRKAADKLSALAKEYQ